MAHEKHYVIKSPVRQYRCKIRTYGTHDTLFFGGTRRCIVVTVHHEDALAHIDGAGWHAYCSKSGMMPRAENGTIDMIRTCITFVFRKYKTITVVTLVDSSKIECNDATLIELAPHYILKYGKTWYEKHFGAHLEDPKEATLYAVFLSSLKKPVPFEFDEFDKRFLQKSFLRPKQLAAVKKEIEPYYKKAESLLGFLREVNAHYDCSIFQNWLLQFMKLYSGVNFNEAYWVINKSTWRGNESVSFQKSKEAFDWSQFGGMLSHIALRHGLPLGTSYRYFDQ